MTALTPQQESRLLSGDEQIDTIRALVSLFDDYGALIGNPVSAVNKAYEVLSHAALLHPKQEAIAKLLWHRFGDSSVEEWEDETHKAEFLEAADDVIFRARSRDLAPPDETPAGKTVLSKVEMRRLVRGTSREEVLADWFEAIAPQAPIERTLVLTSSDKLLIAEALRRASTVPNGEL